MKPQVAASVSEELAASTFKVETLLHKVPKPRK
jgi:hypothetical protein